MTSPRLMIFFDKRVSRDVVTAINEAVDSGKHLAFGPDARVYQLVGGKWEPIDKRDSEPLTEDEARAEFAEKILDAGTMTRDEVCRREKEHGTV